MDIPPLFLSLLTSILLLPFFILLILVPKTFLKLTIPFIHLHPRAHFSWQPNSSLLPSHATKPHDDDDDDDDDHHHEMPSVVRFKAHLNEQVECVFCLSNIEEGAKIRELRCHHLFHKSCLDGWLEHPHARCPLCRASLSTKFKVEDMDDEEIGTSIVPFVAYVHNAWWVW